MNTGICVLVRYGNCCPLVGTWQIWSGSDPKRARILLTLRNAPAYPSDLAQTLNISRQSFSNNLACLRGCGLVVAVPEGRRTRYELADAKIGHALTDLLAVVLAVDPEYCAATGERRRILSAGTGASSSALIGFGLDSVVEVSSAAALAWQFSAHDPQTGETTALRIIALSFFALAAFVATNALTSVAMGTVAEHSSVGIVLAALSLAIMPLLSWAQRRAGGELGPRSVVADSKQTLLCTYLSAALLVGLLLNSALGWAWG